MPHAPAPTPTTNHDFMLALQQSQSGAETEALLPRLVAGRALQLSLAAQYAGALSENTQDEILREYDLWASWVQNPKCPVSALETITADTIARCHGRALSSADLPQVSLLGAISTRDDSYGARARAALTDVLRLELSHPGAPAAGYTRTVKIIQTALAHGVGADEDLALIIRTVLQNGVQMSVAKHPSLGPMAWAALLERSLSLAVVRQLGERARRERCLPLRDAVLAFLFARLEQPVEYNSHEEIGRAVLDLGTTLSPDQYRSSLRLLATHAPRAAVRLFEGGSVARRASAQPEDLGPLLVHPDDSIREAVLRLLHRVPVALEPSAETTAPARQTRRRR